MQGFNMGRYLPPDWDPSKGDWNKQAGKNHALGNRASKLKTQGILTVRFEMPFNIWCSHCEGHIAQGVRFNAEKKKIGNYYTTPIFSFRIKHNVCSGSIEIHTDPQHTTYKVVEGGRKQAEDYDGKDQGVIQIKDPDEIARLENPFAKLEQTVNNKTELSQQSQRIQDLYDASDRQWDDPYSHSQKIRRIFREEKKVRKEKHAASEAIRDRHSLAIPLLEESNEDIRLAKMIDFSNVAYQNAIDEARSAPLFTDSDSERSKTASNKSKEGQGMLRKDKALKFSRDRLQKDLLRNTREKLDPFLLENKNSFDGNIWNKKKRHLDEPQDDGEDPEPQHEPQLEFHPEVEVEISRVNEDSPAVHDVKALDIHHIEKRADNCTTEQRSALVDYSSDD